MNRNPREKAEDREKKTLCAFATLSASAGGRDQEEEPCRARTVFQVDCHRVVHSKAFRRLKGKTLIVSQPKNLTLPELFGVSRWVVVVPVLVLIVLLLWWMDSSGV